MNKLDIVVDEIEVRPSSSTLAIHADARTGVAATRARRAAPIAPEASWAARLIEASMIVQAASEDSCGVSAAGEEDSDAQIGARTSLSTGRGADLRTA